MTDSYEETTGHLVTCLVVAGGEPDPDCCGNENPDAGCTCRPPDPVTVDSWYPAHRPTCALNNPTRKD